MVLSNIDSTVTEGMKAEANVIEETEADENKEDSKEAAENTDSTDNTSTEAVAEQ